ncbi:MAG: response regulator [Aggregatilineales bacterium]
MKPILIVENDKSNRDLFGTLLKMYGYATVEVETAEQALSYIETTRPAAILLDILLPGMDGFLFTKIIRNRAQTADIPIIVVTARNTRPEDKELIVSGNYEAYFHKPVSVESIKSQLHATLG